MSNKHETHKEGLEYVRNYLESHDVNTEIEKNGSVTHLRIVGGRNNGKIIGVGATREHGSTLISREPGRVKYDYNIVVTGMKYTIKKVYIMYDSEARILANEAPHAYEGDSRVSVGQLMVYRDSVGILQSGI